MQYETSILQNDFAVASISSQIKKKSRIGLKWVGQVRAFPFEILRGGADWRQKKNVGGLFAKKIKCGGSGKKNMTGGGGGSKKYDGRGVIFQR